VLIAAYELLDRVRHRRSRADELAALRRRLVRVARGATAAERALGDELRRLRGELAEVIGELAGCARCARGCALPAGRWSGGQCCSGETAGLFDDDELAALRLGGTRPRHLVAPRGDHAGCAFRGAAGCSLAVAHRPNRCVAYLCRDAVRELHAGGRLARAEALVEALAAATAALREVRRDRELDAMLAGRASAGS
jgi:hypothetical protein